MQYYVHYVDYNKRLDEWVTEDRLDTRKIEPPQGKEEKEKHATGATTTGFCTPKKTTAAPNSSTANTASVTSSVNLSIISPAFLLELSMAVILEDCSEQ